MAGGVTVERPAIEALTSTQALYDRIAPGYHRWWAPVIKPAALHLLDLVAPVVDDRGNAILVDVGAGTGPLARAAVARWPRVKAIAVDPSGGMLDLGRAEAETTLDRSALPRLSWVTGVAERLPVEDGSADVVVSSFVFQYLRSRAAALREAHRILRPGGAVAVVTWLDNDMQFVPWRLLGELLDELHIPRPPSAETALFRSLPSAATLLRRAGFRAVRAISGLVEHQWTLDAFMHCAWEAEELELLDSLDDDTRGRLDRLWRERLARLPENELRYRDLVAYVMGERPSRPIRPGTPRRQREPS
jgi:ubiquinone/menaquinone biosynthesis C-methylase UbiE